MTRAPAATHRRHILALIPARGGSKGAPRKNVRVVAGKPLIAYSIEQALASRHITRTIVSTDDAEIAEVAQRYGAEVPFRRPARFARDRSTDFEVFHHALAWLGDREDYECDLVVHLRPTSPVRRVALIDKAIETMLRHPRAHSLRSVSRAEQSPYKMWRVKNGTLEPLLRVRGMAEAHSVARQQLPDVYWQNGYIDIIRPHVILDLRMMAGRQIVPFVVREPVPGFDHEEDVPQLEQTLSALAHGAWPGAAGARGMRHAV
jgi:N-acylneuraminate cytidylyltransferase